jgi:hypothetical protein
MAFPLLILSDLTPSCAATRSNSNLVADDCTAMALERIEPDGSPTRPFPPHQVSTGLGWTSLTVHHAPALPTAPSARTGVPVKHALGLHSSSKEDEEPPQLVSCGFKGGDTIERMERKCASAGPPVIFWAHVPGLGRGQAASNGAPCTNQAAEFNMRRLKGQRKAEAGAPPVLIPPIPELDQQCLILSKVSSIRLSLALYLSSHCGPPGPPNSRHHPSKTTRRQVHLSISVLAAYTTQLMQHAVSC